MVGQSYRDPFSSKLHVSWDELFFDLSLVVAVGKLTERFYEALLEDVTIEWSQFAIELFCFWW